MINEESNETTVTRKQDKVPTYVEDVADWVGNMLTNKYECSSKVTISGRTMYNHCTTMHCNAASIAN